MAFWARLLLPTNHLSLFTALLPMLTAKLMHKVLHQVEHGRFHSSSRYQLRSVQNDEPKPFPKYSVVEESFDFAGS
jgi:hypothetical protein